MKIDCIFIHGWAMNSAIWQRCLQHLPDWINPLCIDLPGYGRAIDVDATTLDEYVDYVTDQISRPALLTGWSLGGLVTLRLAQRHPHKVAGLLQVATNPKFVQQGSWLTAIDAGVFEQFAAALEQNATKTIQRFLALQVRGTDTSLQTVRELQRSIEECGLPQAGVLQDGLRILSATDLIQAVSELQCPVAWLLGDKDALVPVALVEALNRLAPEAQITVIHGAGHAPFISHPEIFAHSVVRAARRI